MGLQAPPITGDIERLSMYVVDYINPTITAPIIVPRKVDGFRLLRGLYFFPTPKDGAVYSTYYKIGHHAFFGEQEILTYLVRVYEKLWNSRDLEDYDYADQIWYPWLGILDRLSGLKRSQRRLEGDLA